MIFMFFLVSECTIKSYNDHMPSTHEKISSIKFTKIVRALANTISVTNRHSSRYEYGRRFQEQNLFIGRNFAL